MHRPLSAAAMKDDLLVIADLAGLVHCLDAKTGKVYWTHDLMSQIWGSPCLVEGKIYIGDQDGYLQTLAEAYRILIDAREVSLTPTSLSAGGGAMGTSAVPGAGASRCGGLSMTGASTPAAVDSPTSSMSRM